MESLSETCVYYLSTKLVFAARVQMACYISRGQKIALLSKVKVTETSESYVMDWMKKTNSFAAPSQVCIVLLYQICDNAGLLTL